MLSVRGEASAGAGVVSAGALSCLTRSRLLLIFLCGEQANEEDTVERRNFTSDQRKSNAQGYHQGSR
jgi:hypothetical protein